MENKILIESALADELKWDIIDYLNEEGYATYARRLKAYKFIIADMYHGNHIEVAAMFPELNEIVVNPSMIDDSKMSVFGDNREAKTKKMEQLSVLIRHELLHFLLVHQKRLVDLLAKKHPEWKQIFSNYTINDLANRAMDYEISLDGYDNYDKEVVRLMTLNNEVVGGLIADDDHPEWGHKTMEEMLELLMDKIVQENKDHIPQTTIRVHKLTHSPEYVQTYNDILKLLDDKKYSDGDLATILSAAITGDEVIDVLNNNILLAKGE